MTIYLDYIFIENFLIDCIFLKETSYIARKGITHRRIIISAIIASAYVVFMMYLKIEELNYFICKILLVIIMIYISFHPKSIDEYIKLIALFFLISVINVGTLTVVTNLLNIENTNILLKLIVYIASLLLSKMVMQHMWKLYKQEIKSNDLIYQVKICLGDKIYKYNAFLDTGNNVYSYAYNIPVIFAEILDEDMSKELKNKEVKESFNIRTVTLSNESNKRAYIFDKVEITKKDKTWYVRAAIVFEKTKLSKGSSYNMLLNYILYTQDLGGIKI